MGFRPAEGWGGAVPRISRAARAEAQRRARQIRQRGQLAGRSVASIAGTIQAQVPGIRSLEAWRLAYGWSRPHVIAGIATLYERDGLAVPGINSSMLCRWEHGDAQPGHEYGRLLCRFYRARPDQLGLAPPAAAIPLPRTPTDAPAGPAAVWESVELVMEVEGPAGGPLTLAQLGQAVQYYAADYSRIPPDRLNAEVHRCRTAVNAMLGHSPPATVRSELCVLGGWLSALLGNLAHHRGEHTVADIHLRTAAGLAAETGHARLRAWASWARSMVARHQGHAAAALELAHAGNALAREPLRQAQGLAWAEVPALVALGHDPSSAIAAAQRAMDTAAGEEPGRFGFDRAEFHLHLAEALLAAGKPAAALAHAGTSRDRTSPGSPSWVAATLALAVAEVRRGELEHAVELAVLVLDTVPADRFRDTSRRRLTRLVADLNHRDPAGTAHFLGDRLRAISWWC
jgi:hypothetical protein